MTAITIRPAVSDDADGIARVFLESAEHHAALDPERYFVPAIDRIFSRYRDGLQHFDKPAEESITLVAELDGEVVGFVDARLDRSPDPMHRDIIYSHVAEIAVSRRHQRRGIGGQLVRAAEEWGRERGAAFASLDFHPANTRASNFYQHRMGYSAAAVTAIKRL
jgi:ribosomal protein S18 acetylase RimI-like enzyme